MPIVLASDTRHRMPVVSDAYPCIRLVYKDNLIDDNGNIIWAVIQMPNGLLVESEKRNVWPIVSWDNCQPLLMQLKLSRTLHDMQRSVWPRANTVVEPCGMIRGVRLANCGWKEASRCREQGTNFATSRVRYASLVVSQALMFRKLRCSRRRTSRGEMCFKETWLWMVVPQIFGDILPMHGIMPWCQPVMFRHSCTCMLVMCGIGIQYIFCSMLLFFHEELQLIIEPVRFC